MKRTLLLLFISLLTFSSFQSVAQSKGTLTGRITTADAIAAADITVRLKGTGIQQITDATGRYSFKNIKSGSYTISISGVGTKTQEKTIQLSAIETVTVNFTLQQTSDQLKEVSITSHKKARVIQKSSEYAAKMPLNNLENPQVYSSLTKEVLAQQLIFNLDDALKNIPGVSKKYENAGFANSSTFFSLRGFSVQSNFRNGMVSRLAAGADNANIERIEVLKGPSATLFGSSLTSYGGLINRVTKKPYAGTGVEVTAATGSFSFNRMTADFNAPLDSAKKALFRVNAAYQDENSFRDNGFRNSIFIAPTFSYQVNDRLVLSMDAEFSHVKQGGGFNSPYSFIQASILKPLFGIPATMEYDMTIKKVYGISSLDEVKINKNLSYTANDLFTTTNSANFITEANYKISSQWTSQTLVSSNIARSFGYNTYMFILPDAIIQRNPAVSGYSNALRLVNKPEIQQNSLQLQQNFIGDFKIGTMRNRLTAGLEYYQNKYTQQPNSYNAKVLGITYESLFDVVPLSGPVPNYDDFNKTKVDAVQAAGTRSTLTYNSNMNNYAAYVADVLNVTDRLLVMLSLRADRYQNKPFYNAAADTSSAGYKQSTLSPKFGVVYQLVEDQVSLFGNIQNGFSNNPGNNYEGEAFKPEKAFQFEGGIKANTMGGRLSATLSYYDIKVSDIIRSDVSHFGYSIQDGVQKSKGVEAELVAAPVDGLTVIAGYAYNDSKYTKADADVQGLRPVESGAKNLANFWVNYRLSIPQLNGLGAGIGANYAGKAYAVNSVSSGQLIIPSFTVFNAALSYDKAKFSVGLKMNNLTNKTYWIGWNAINVQQPRAVLGSLTYKF